MEEFKVISLDEFVRQYFDVDVVSPADNPAMQYAWKLEQLLHRLLPQVAVRHIVRSFGTSYTVHPDSARTLYAIARCTQAKTIIETGTYWGYSTNFLAQGQLDQGVDGKVISFDLDPHAGRYIAQHLRSRIVLHLGKPSSESMPLILPGSTPEFFFQDSVHDYEGVSNELKIAKPYLAQRAVVLFHDFVSQGARRAALEQLPDFEIFQLAGADPQELGIAIRTA